MRRDETRRDVKMRREEDVDVKMRREDVDVDVYMR